MSHIATGAGRGYHSELRRQQAEATRDRILEATVKVMADGIATLSIPDVARVAGVSVPTVYRHFGSKTELLAAVYPYLVRRAGATDIVYPETLDDLRGAMATNLRNIDRFDELAMAALASPASAKERARHYPARLAFAQRLLETVEPPLRRVDRDRIARILVVLTTSASMRTWRDRLDSSVDEAADDLDWIMRAAIAAARATTDRQR